MYGGNVAMFGCERGEEEKRRRGAAHCLETRTIQHGEDARIREDIGRDQHHCPRSWDGPLHVSCEG